VIDPAFAVTTITDTIDSTTLTLAGDATATEGSTATYHLSLDNPTQTDLTINIITEYIVDEADADDFTAITQTFIIKAGDTIPKDINEDEIVITVNIANDTEAEGNESYQVTIDSVSGGNFESLIISDPVVTTIVDSDIEFAVENVEVDEDAIGVIDSLLDTDGDSVINQSTDRGGITLVGATILAFAAGQVTTLTSSGEAIVLSTSLDGQVITGTTITSNTEVFTATLANDGLSYTFELTSTIDHSDVTSEDVEILNLDIVATNDVTSQTVTIAVSIADDVPSITNSLDAMLTNEIGNEIEGIDLDIQSGADIPVLISMSPTINGDGYAVDSSGNLLTSTVDDVTYNITYTQLADGSVEAYNTNGDLVFTLSPDMDGTEYEGTYSISIDGQLDGGAYSYSVDLSSGSDFSGGNDTIMQFISTDDLHVLATANGGSTVNYNPANGLGVGDGGVISDTEELTFNLTQNDDTTPYYVSDATFTLARFSSGETAYWQAFNGTTLVGEGSVSGLGNEAHDDGIAEISTNISGFEGTTFNEIVFSTPNDGSGYSVLDMDLSYDYEVAGNPHSIDVTVNVSDSDLDVASNDITITFDGDGVMTYESGTIIDGGAGEDTLVIEDEAFLDFSLLAQDQITDIENLDLSGGTNTTLTNLTIDRVFDMTDDNNILNIMGDNDDSVQRPLEWGTSTGTTVIDGETYNQYSAINGTEIVYLNIQENIDEEIV